MTSEQKCDNVAVEDRGSSPKSLSHEGASSAASFFEPQSKNMGISGGGDRNGAWEPTLENCNWLKLYRKVISNPVFQDARLFQIFIYCLCRANFKETKILFNGEEVVLRPGEFISGRHEASKALKLKGIMWDRKLHVLENLGILNRKVNNQFSIITIINWDTYQSTIKHNEQVGEHRMNNGRTSDEHRMNTDKNEKKDKKEKNITTFADYAETAKSAVAVSLKENFDVWKKAFPALDLDTESTRALSWLLANPKNRKSNIARFLRNWLSRAQEKAPRAMQSGPKTMKQMVAEEGL